MSYSTQLTEQISNDPPGMGTKSTTTSNHPSTPDFEVNQMTLSSKNRTRNASPDGLRPTMLPLGHRGSRHNSESLRVGVGITFVSLKGSSDCIFLCISSTLQM